MKKTFFLPFVISFILGIVFSENTFSYLLLASRESIVSCFFISFILLALRKNKWFFYLLFYVFGVGIVHFQAANKQLIIPNQLSDVSIKLLKSSVSEKGLSMYGRIIRAEKDLPVRGEKVYIFLKTDKSPDFRKGDLLKCSAIKLESPVSNNLPFEFDFDRFLIQQGITCKAFVNDMTSISRIGKVDMPGRYFERINNTWQHAFNNSFCDPKAIAILSALSLGDKSNLEDETKAVFADTGSMHILAVSGLHVGIIYLIIQKLISLFFFQISLKKWMCWGIGILVIWTFTGITGSSPATIRAASMLSIYATGVLLQNRTNIIHTIAIVAFILLCIEPLSIYKLSFQFSFLALCSIVIFQPLIQSIFLPENNILSYLLQLFYLSISVQILTAPLTIYYFHQFPIYFFLSGIIAVPFAGLLLSLICIYIFSFMLFNWVPGILIQLTEGATHVMYYLLKWISALPYSTLSTDRIYLYDFVCYYAMVIVLTNFFIGHAKIKQLRRAIFILFAWASCYSFQSWNSSTQQILVKKTIAGNELFCLVKGKSCMAIRPVPRVKEKWESTLKEIQKYYNTSGFSYVDQEVLSSQSPIDIKKWKGQSNSMFKMGISERLTNYLQAKS